MDSITNDQRCPYVGEEEVDNDAKSGGVVDLDGLLLAVGGSDDLSEEKHGTQGADSPNDSPDSMDSEGNSSGTQRCREGLCDGCDRFQHDSGKWNSGLPRAPHEEDNHHVNSSKTSAHYITRQEGHDGYSEDKNNICNKGSFD